MTAVCTILIKEADKFTPFLKFGSAAKDPKVAFAFTIVWKNNINSTVRRIYSGRPFGLFFDGSHFSRENGKNFFSQ